MVDWANVPSHGEQDQASNSPCCLGVGCQKIGLVPSIFLGGTINRNVLYIDWLLSFVCWLYTYVMRILIMY